MTDMTDQQAVTVAQEDREAAHDLAMLHFLYTNEQMQGIKSGTLDHVSFVQAFARHRLASVSSASAEEAEHLQTIDERDAAEAALSDAYRAVCGKEPAWSNQFDYNDAINEIRETAASPEPVPATNQAGEVDAGDIGKVLAWAITGQSVYGTGLLRPIIERLCRAALATQPATSQEGETREPMSHLGIRYTVAGVMAEMLAVGTADDEGDLAEDWPLDCRADVDRWQAVIRPALTATPTPPALPEDKLNWRKIAKAAGEYGVRYRTNTALERFLSEIAATPTPALSGDLREACERLLLAMTTRALRGRDHVPSMRDEQDAASALRAALTATPTPPTLSEDLREALCKRVFLDAHSDGWTGNQMRRDVQHVDAEKSWKLYVSNGALAKSIDDLVTVIPKTREAALVGTGKFLLDRLVDHEVHMTSDSDAREWYGHVTPAMERFRAALAQVKAS